MVSQRKRSGYSTIGMWYRIVWSNHCGDRLPDGYSQDSVPSSEFGWKGTFPSARIIGKGIGYLGIRGIQRDGIANDGTALLQCLSTTGFQRYSRQQPLHVGIVM